MPRCGLARDFGLNDKEASKDPPILELIVLYSIIWY